MPPELETVPSEEEQWKYFYLKLLPGEPEIIGHGFVGGQCRAIEAILTLREKMIESPPKGEEDELVKAQVEKAVRRFSEMGMPEEMAREFIKAVIDKTSGVVVRFKTRPLLPEELPEGLRLGEHTGYDFELVKPEF